VSAVIIAVLVAYVAVARRDIQPAATAVAPSAQLPEQATSVTDAEPG
jgi:hypothetical protein